VSTRNAMLCIGFSPFCGFFFSSFLFFFSFPFLFTLQFFFSIRCESGLGLCPIKGYTFFLHRSTHEDHANSQACLFEDSQDFFVFFWGGFGGWVWRVGCVGWFLGSFFCPTLNLAVAFFFFFF